MDALKSLALPSNGAVTLLADPVEKVHLRLLVDENQGSIQSTCEGERVIGFFTQPCIVPYWNNGQSIPMPGSRLYALVATSKDEMVADLSKKVGVAHEVVRDLRTEIKNVAQENTSLTKRAQSMADNATKMELEVTQSGRELRETLVRYRKLEQDLAAVKRVIGEKAYNEATATKVPA